MVAVSLRFMLLLLRGLYTTAFFKCVVLRTISIASYIASVIDE
jgi:hypothetical protein